MSHQYALRAVALLAALLMADVAATTVAAQAQNATQYPDWSGQRRRAETGAPRYDSTKPSGRGQQAPLTEEYRAVHEASMADQAAGGQGGDTTYRCLPMGMPRAMTTIFPLEFIITPKVTFVLFENSNALPRRIYTDGRGWPQDQEPTFVGYSVGTWSDTDGDGRYDTLEVETRNLRGPRTFDNTGIPFHKDNLTVVKEKLTLDKANPDLLVNEITTIDPALTRPWSTTKRYKLEREKVIWSENSCAEGNNHVAVGNENYMISGDGYLMPVRKGQAPPDTRYFRPVAK
jgi:hypothetical protein